MRCLPLVKVVVHICIAIIGTEKSCRKETCSLASGTFLFSKRLIFLQKNLKNFVLKVIFIAVHQHHVGVLRGPGVWATPQTSSPAGPAGGWSGRGMLF